MNIRETFKQWEAERPDLNLSSLSFSIAVLRLAKLIEDEFDKGCRDRFDLPANDVRVLLALRRSGEPYMLRPTDLFQALLITAGAVTKQVDRLSARGLVRRKPDPAHAGGTLVRLTAKGRAIADDITTMVATKGRVHTSFKSLPVAQRSVALAFLLDLMDRIDQATIKA